MFQKSLVVMGAVLYMAGRAASAGAFGIEIRGGLGLGTLDPPKVSTFTQAADSANVFCGEGGIGIRFTRRLSAGLSTSLSSSKYDQELAGIGWEVTQTLVSGNIYGQYNFMDGGFRPYLRASVGSFNIATTIVDKATRTAVSKLSPDSALHASLGLGGEAAFTKRFYGFLEAQYHSFSVGDDQVPQVNALIGIGYTFSDMYKNKPAGK